MDERDWARYPPNLKRNLRGIKLRRGHKMRSIDSSAGNLARGMRVLLAGTAISVAATLPAAAQNATWNGGTTDYNLATNWSTGAAPSGIATFAGATPGLSFSADATVGEWVFNSPANYTFTNDHTLTFNGAGISVTDGSATITNNAASNLIFNNGSTAGSAAIFNNGQLTFNDTSTAGNATITTGGPAGFTSFLGSSTGGNASFVTQSGGTVDISGITAGNFSTGSIAGAGDYVIGNKILSVGNDNSSTTVSGVISGVDGELTKVGTGTLTLSGANTYTGNTFVQGGSLIVNGSIGDVSALGGVFGGTGTAGIVNVGNTGTFAPGSGVAGTSMTVSALGFDSFNTYLVHLDPSSASHVNVTNTANLQGTVNAQFAPGSYVAHSYTILTTGSGLGGTTFDALTTNGLPAGFTASLGYTSNDVLLNLDAILGVTIGSTLNRNQQNTAISINNFFNNGGTLPTAFNSLFGLTGPALGTALTQLSGETAIGSQQTSFGAMTQFMGVMTDPFMAGRGDDAAAGAGAASFADEGDGGKRVRDAYGMYAKAPLSQVYEPRWSVWAAGFGGSQTTDGSTAAGSNNTTSRIFGSAVGADYRFSPFTIAGFALAGGGTNFSVANGGSGRSDLFQAGAHLRHTVGPAYIAAALAYGWQDITTDRTVTAAGIDRLRAEFNANTWSGRLEGGYRLVSPWIGGLGITPYAAGQFTNFDRPAYAESVVSGASAFALAYGSKSVTDSRSELGVRTDKSFAMPNGVLTLRGRAAWAHDFNPDPSIAATFQALPGASFVVNGAAQASNSALTTASAEMKWLNGWSAAATFEGEFSDVTRSYAGKGVVRYAW
jgi:autotransporter-associated beta strand protein